MSTMSTTSLPTQKAARWRGPATRVGSGLLALAFGVLFFGLPLLVLAWFSAGADAMHQVHGVGWGVTAGLLLAVGFGSQAVAPRAYAGMQSAVAATVALIAVGLAAGGLLQLAPIVVVAAIAVAVHPQRAQLARMAPRSRALLALVALAAVPLLVYAADQVGLARAALPGDPHVAEDNHYQSMAAMAVGLLLVGSVAAARQPGWRVPLYTAGLGMALFGVASIASAMPGSVGPIWGTAALVGGVAFVAVGEVEAQGAIRRKVHR